jgi:hypothetical protein
MADMIHSFDFVFNEEDKKDREMALTLTTDYFDNGNEDYGFFSRQKLTTESYHVRPVSFEFYKSILTPAILRALADKLEQEQKRTVELKKQFLFEKAMNGTAEYPINRNTADRP